MTCFDKIMIFEIVRARLGFVQTRPNDNRAKVSNKIG